ncbi:hypothetical protein LZ017_19505 [Pelomonas sp. CA6]|uniref:hypothetical protein n=1 Tax=Pelomonas sp. CA6 TaxID=2907999 RepID=UPI001F4C0107|nr:hypothetical protein [Pelomonas sp. CA6]MCH7345563.1 hypothetical protein [Pelomonas sp. CA6]
MSIEWSYGAVAFIDVLGFSAFVESDAKSIAPVHLPRLSAVLARVREASPDLDVRAFSDSITITAPLESAKVANLLKSVVELQRLFIEGGVLVRGGVAFGKHFADESLVFSEALIRAYVLERDQARFPRILVAADLLDWYFHDPATTAELAAEAHSLLLTDRDNFTFLDYLHSATLKPHLDAIQAYKIANSTPSVLEKVQWLCQYHNFRAAASGSEHVYSGPMVDGFRQHVILP